MLDIILLFLFIGLSSSTPLYRLDPKEPLPTATEILSEIALPLPTESVLPPTAITQIVPAEEIPKVVSALVLEQNFDLVMPEPKESGKDSGISHKSRPGEMETIRKPAPIIDMPVVSLEDKKNILPATVKEPITTEHTHFEEKSNGRVDFVDLEDLKPWPDSAEDEQKDDEGPPKEEKPCDKPFDDVYNLAKPVVPGDEVGLHTPFDEESLFRILIYIISILTEPEFGEPSTWQKIVAGIQCVLRDCREALPLRPTMKAIPLDEQGFIIRRARDSLCNCYIDL